MASDTEHLPLEIDAVSPFNSVVIFPRFNVFSQLPATDFGAFVINILSHTSPKSETIDQKVLRGCIQLASSFLVTDTTTNPERGISTWSVGFCRLVDLVVVLHTRNELELETVSAASKACSECWTAAGNWPGLNECRNRVRDIGGRLKKVLDSNERTYRGMLLSFFLSSPFITCFFILGERVYAPWISHLNLLLIITSAMNTEIHLYFMTFHFTFEPRVQCTGRLWGLTLTMTPVY